MRLALAAALGAALALPALSQMPETPPGKWWKRPRVVQMLKLTPEQQEKLEEIFARNRKSFVDLKADVEKNQIDVEELVAKKDADPKKVSSAVDALEQSRMRLRKSVTMMFLEQKAVLTSQQWSVLLERRDEWRRERGEERRRGEMERRGDMSPDGAPAPPRSPAGSQPPQ
ncbi:MAG TPA: periplasmic heavy metal sensor [Thermoanaerobaculia bacterium]|nr:periplasmic heavy metal sensor [Thermoanaerobaculia bacterium]